MLLFSIQPSILKKALFCSLLLSLLAGCGGGGGGGGGTDAGPATPTNSPPRFTSATEFSFSENQPVRFVVSVTDPDGDTVTISDAGTGDGGLFELNATSGAVTALTENGAFNFENPLDLDGDNVYVQSFTLNDGQTSVTQTVSVTITNEIEPPRYLGSTDFTVGEGTTGLAISATDDDSSELTFALSGTDADAFLIGSGNLNFVDAPDFENPSDADIDNVYDVTLSITNSDDTIDVNLTVAITNQNEPPVCVSDETFSFPENTLGEIFTFTATDPEGDPISFENFGVVAENILFENLSVDPLTGIVTLAQEIDFEALANPSGQLSVSAGETVCTASFTVTDVEGVATSGIKLLGGASLVAPAGDVDGDGVDDLWLTTPSDNGWQGSIVFGDYLSGAMPAGTLNTEGAAANEVLPILLSAESAINSADAKLVARPVGDIDGDNVNELFIGFTRCDGCADQRQMAYLIWGSTIQNNTSNSLILDELAADEVLTLPFRTQASAVLAFASGDYDGDGLADIAFGIPTPGEESFVMFGDFLAASKTAGTVNFSNATQQQVLDLNIDYLALPFAGEDMAQIMDIDGDSNPELVLTGSQWVYVIHSSTISNGRTSGNLQIGSSFDLEINATSGVTALNQRPYDLSGDGIPEIAWLMPSGGLASVAIGETYATTPNSKFVDDTVNLRTSAAISTISDVSNDGSNELVLLSRTPGDSQPQEVRIITGEVIDAVALGFFVDLSSTMPGETLAIQGITSQGGQQLSVTGFADLDGDGLEELVVSNVDEAEIYVLRGEDLSNALTAGNTEIDINSLLNNE